VDVDFIKKKKVMIAGGSGLLGISLTKLLIAIGVSVESTYFSRIPPDDIKVYYKQYDFTRFKDCLAATAGKNYVLICAGHVSGVAEQKKNPMAQIRPNLQIHTGLLEACSQNNVEKVVWISSSTVYQEAFYAIREDQLDMNKLPYQTYQGIGLTYRYLEQLTKFYYQSQGLQIGIIRTSYLYGPYDRFDEKQNHVIPALIKRALRKEKPFVVWGKVHVVRDFIYVDDLSKAILKVLKSYCIAEPINFSYGIPVTIGELVHLILDVCGHKVLPQYDPDKPTSIPYRVLDNTKFNGLFGEMKKTILAEGIRKTVAWYTSEFYRE